MACGEPGPRPSPCVGISTRAVGGGVSASPGQGRPLIEFAEATGALPVDLAPFGTGAVSFSVAAIVKACSDPAEWPPELDPSAAPVQANLVTGADPSTASPPSSRAPRGGTVIERRDSSLPPLRSREVVAEFLGFTNRDVLSRPPTFLTGARSFVVPASYEPLDSVCSPLRGNPAQVHEAQEQRQLCARILGR